MKLLKIYRENNKVDHDIPYKVLIDNIPVFEIVEEEVKDYKLEPGKHKISVKSDKYISNELEFIAANDLVQEFTIRPDYENNFLSKIFTSTIYGKVGIKISIKKEFYL